MWSHRKPLNFHRLILSDDINKLSIRIPNKFTREHRKNILSNNVSLIVPDDKLWSLGLTISGDGKLWLQQGWPEFAEHYSLKTGHLLLFAQQGRSVFHVRIFDQSSCEIDYSPPKTSSNFENETDQPLYEDDEIMAMAESEALHAPTIFQEIQASEKGSGVDEHRSRSRAFELSNSLKSDNPFYSVTRKASYFNWGLHVPVPFMRRYLLSGDEKCVNCYLQVSDGGMWGPVKCRDYKTYGKLYGDNWKKFRDENHLGAGDVCVVELVDKMEKVLKVTIFRAR